MLQRAVPHSTICRHPVVLLDLWAKGQRRNQTCRLTGFNRSCTGNDVLWSLLTVCNANTQLQNGIPYALRTFLTQYLDEGSESSKEAEQTFHQWNFHYQESKYVAERKFQLPQLLHYSINFQFELMR